MQDDPNGRRLDDPADAEAIARVLAGETEQFACLVRRYQRALFRQALVLLLDPDAAADMVQDAFVRAYTNLADCRDPDRFRAWLFQTLRHRCLDYLKDVRRRTVPLDEAPAVPDSAAGPAERAERAQLRGAITAALLTLPPEQREAFVLHYVDDMPYERIAEELRVSVSAVKMRALRARQALAQAMRRPRVTRAAGSSSVVGSPIGNARPATR